MATLPDQADRSAPERLGGGAKSRRLDKAGDGERGFRPGVFAGCDGATLGTGRKRRSLYSHWKTENYCTHCRFGRFGGTPPKGVEAGVIEVKSFPELRALGADKVKGKIVFFNRPMDPTKINTFEAYGGAVDQRGQWRYRSR